MKCVQPIKTNRLKKYEHEHDNFHGTIKKVKVKVTLVQALRLCTGRTAQRGSRGIALLFL
jgi:hypothetical protein